MAQEMESAQMKPLAVIPTYNEAENIVPLVNRLKAAVPHIEVLVVDDGSPDGTADLIDGQAQVLRRSHKQGLGPAYLAGFRWGLERGFDPIIEIDADGSHPPERLPALLSYSDSYDLVIGSRWVKGGATQNWPLSRQLISRLGNLYVRLLLGMKVKDATAGYRVYRKDLLQSLDLDAVVSSGYGFQIELTFRSHQRGAKIKEIPIIFTERENGTSKMSRSIIIEALWQTTKWGLGRLTFISAKKR